MRRRPRVRLWLLHTALLATAAALLLPVVLRGPAAGHDTGVHMVWLEHFRRSLAEGCWHPRWLGEVNNGFGSPTFIFYFPAYSYGTALARALVPDLAKAMWLTSGLALWASGVAMFVFLRRHCGRGAALLGAIVYMAAPYRMLDLYERGAHPESMAFLWPPLILAAIDMRERPALSLSVTALCMGGLVFTHHGMAAMFLPVFAGYTMVCRPPRSWAGPLAALALGLGIGAASLLPAVLEREHLRWNIASHRQAFLFGSQPTFVPSFASVLDRDAIYYCGAAVFGLAVAVGRRTRVAALFAAVAVLSLFVATAIAEPVWDLVTALQFIDLPWRFLALATLANAILIGAAATERDWLRHAALGCAMAAVVFAVCDWVLPSRVAATPPPQRLLDPSWPDRLHLRPRWAPDEPPRADGPSFTGGSVRRISSDCRHRVYEVIGRREGRLDLDLFYFPGWTASIDGVTAAITPNIVDGRITMRGPKGRYFLRLDFRDTPVRAWSDRLTLASLAVTLLVAGIRQARTPPIGDPSAAGPPA